MSRTQLEAAFKLGVDAQTYWAAEKDQLTAEEERELLSKIEEPPLSLPGALRLARRRSPMTLSEIAASCGVGSRPTFYKLEAAGDRRVLSFWLNQGYRFPENLISG